MIQLINRSGIFKRKLNENQKAALDLTGELLVKYMNHYVAVDTGYLQSRNQYQIMQNELYLYNDCNYAIYQEYGTYKMAPHPFMRPAAFNHTSEIRQIWAMSLSNGM